MDATTGARRRLRSFMLALCSGVVTALDSTRTIYHVNPLRFGAVPRNMDTADPLGDLFFELFEVFTVPLACADPSVPAWRKPFECWNLETTDQSDVISKVTIRVNSSFSQYAMCNIGSKEGKDPLGRPCPVDGYCCYCNDDSQKDFHWPPRSVPCNATVGAAELHSRYANHSKHHHHFHHRCETEYDCWSEHARAKLTADLPGHWYSFLDIGNCALHPGVGNPNCTWAVLTIDKVVNKTCHTNRLFQAVRQAAPGGFANCSATPNATDPCWLRGFYIGALGPDAGKAVGWKVGGLPLEKLREFWTRPFESDAAPFGCPSLPTKSSTAAPAVLGQSTRQRQWQRYTMNWYGDGDNEAREIVEA